MIDIRASCKKAVKLVGIVVAGYPFNLPDGIGAIAVVIDPAGHPVGMYSRKPLPPTPVAEMRNVPRPGVDPCRRGACALRSTRLTIR